MPGLRKPEQLVVDANPILQLGVPLWSNDRDFEGTNVTQLTTARLLNMFFGPSSR